MVAIRIIIHLGNVIVQILLASIVATEEMILPVVFRKFVNANNSKRRL